MSKQNCWEYIGCGREEGGWKAKDDGVCPVVINKKLDEVNSGLNGGRSCWVIAGTFCEGEVQGEYANKITDCLKCEFYKIVAKEEKRDYKNLREILKIINK